ncbi:MAG TPA: hypothetical protein VMS98_07855 [Thermoanaerobaculia bacterium]|nr:hypothetical protein [Thermoanaerobaculia bacterium]
MTGLAVDADQIASFVNALFRHASPGQMVALRSFVEGESRPFRITVAELGDAGLEPVIKAACCLAQSAADADSPTVFCPPVAGFANFEDPWRAREKDLKEAFALSVECDQRPFGARGLLEELLGPATVVVASGEEWTNPITGDIEPKLHLHWRLSRPAAGDHLAVLKEALLRAVAKSASGAAPWWRRRAA